jgi:hypothetical protein
MASIAGCDNDLAGQTISPNGGMIRLTELATSSAICGEDMPPEFLEVSHEYAFAA